MFSAIGSSVSYYQYGGPDRFFKPGRGLMFQCLGYKAMNLYAIWRYGLVIDVISFNDLYRGRDTAGYNETPMSRLTAYQRRKIYYHVLRNRIVG